MLKSLLCLTPLFFVANLFAQPVITFKPVVSGLSSPVDVVEEVNDSARLFVVEKTGSIRIVKDSTIKTKPFLNISTLVSRGYEQGLLSMAFHPHYATNGLFFIYYTNIAGNVVVARYNRATPDSANIASGVILMNVPKPFPNHNGGKLIFGADGYLYFGIGDGGSGGDPYNNAQTDTSFLGKMLRIDVNMTSPPYYKIPPTNPFYGSALVKQEIIDIGLRNPWRFSFDKQTNDLWIADVGQDHWEEVNVVPYASRLNKNYGWHCYEATHAYNNSCTAQSNTVFPIFEYGHNDSIGGYSVTGGYVYRGNEFPSLQGYYLFADFAKPHGWLTKSNGNGTWTTTLQTNWIQNITSFGQRSDGSLYVTQLTGTLYKIIASNTLPVRLVTFSGKEKSNKYELSWKVDNETKNDVYVLEKKNQSASTFVQVSSFRAPTDKVFNTYSLEIDKPLQETFFRLKIITAAGQIIYSQQVRYISNGKKTLRALMIQNTLNIYAPQGTQMLEVTDETGKKTWQKNNAISDVCQVPIKQRGVYNVRAFVNGEWQLVRIVY